MASSSIVTYSSRSRATITQEWLRHSGMSVVTIGFSAAIYSNSLIGEVAAVISFTTNGIVATVKWWR